MGRLGFQAAPGRVSRGQAVSASCWLRELNAGPTGLFEDPRVDWAIEHFGGVDGASCWNWGRWRALQGKGFCGGSAVYSNWLTRDDLLTALARFGWRVDAIGFDEPGHVNGPAMALVATRAP